MLSGAEIAVLEARGQTPDCLVVYMTSEAVYLCSDELIMGCGIQVLYVKLCQLLADTEEAAAEK